VLVADVDASYAQTAIRKLQPPRSVKICTDAFRLQSRRL